MVKAYRELKRTGNGPGGTLDKSLITKEEYRDLEHMKVRSTWPDGDSVAA